MGKTKIPVRLTTAVTHNPETGAKEVGVRASTKIGGRQITAQGADEDNAIRALKVKVAEHQRVAEFKAEFPKTVEVDL